MRSERARTIRMGLKGRRIENEGPPSLATTPIQPRSLTRNAPLALR